MLHLQGNVGGELRLSLGDFLCALGEVLVLRRAYGIILSARNISIGCLSEVLGDSIGIYSDFVSILDGRVVSPKEEHKCPHNSALAHIGSVPANSG
jgi:hypothetical protein